jgi:hypothetical protein
MRKWGGGEKGGGDIWVRVGASQKSCGRMTQQAKKRVSFAVVFNFIHPTSYSCVRDSIAWYGMDDGVVQTRLRGLSIVLFIRSNFPTGTTGHVPR